MNKKVIIPAIALTILAGTGALGISNAYAQGEDTTYPLVQKLAERFNLDEEEVGEFFEEQRRIRRKEHEAAFEDRLNAAVEEGKITEEQKSEILTKKEEHEALREALMDLSPEDRREAMNEAHEEIKAWAEENGIDFPLFGGPQEGFGKGRHQI